MTASPVARRFASPVVAALIAMLALLLVPFAPLAHAAEQASELNVDAKLAKDGALTVSQTLTFTDAAPAEITQRLANTRETLNKSDYVYTFTDVAASSDGAALPVTTTTDGGYTVIKVTTQGKKAVTISYKVAGTVHAQADRTRFQYRLLQGLSVPVEKFIATIMPPGAFEDFDCKSGPPAATRACNAFQAGTHENPLPNVNDGPLGAGEVVDVSVAFVPGAIDANEKIHQRWSLDRPFPLSMASLLPALLALLAGAAALWALHRRSGEDAAYSSPTPIAEFHPVAEGESEFRLKTDVRPGQVGTLVDERVDPVDVAATLLDLAVRGHLRIHELAPANRHSALDWELERLDGADDLHPYERTLLEAVAPDGARTKVSDLGPVVAGVAPKVQDELYDEMVSKGWYGARPDATRQKWNLIGWVAVAAALVALAILIAFTNQGWLGLVLVGLALSLLLIGREMPARTTHGSSLLGGLMALRQELGTHPTDQMPKGRELAELSEVLPYAVVLGGQDRWVRAVADADTDETPDGTDLSWYHAEGDWHLAQLPEAVDAFLTTVTGRLNRRH